MADKKYYWLKLPENFFENKAIKKLRKIAGGDTYTIIYMKMLLASLKNNGKLFFDGIEDNIASEIALEIDEDADNVGMVLQFLLNTGLLEECEDDEVMLTQLPAMVGSETAAAERKRRSRAKQKIEASETPVIEEKPKRKTFEPPTLEEVKMYCSERGNKVDAQHWFDYYSSNGWMVGKNKMKDWKASVRTWERNSYSSAQKPAINKPGGMFKDFEQRQYDYDAMMKKLGGLS